MHWTFSLYDSFDFILLQHFSLQNQPLLKLYFRLVDSSMVIWYNKITFIAYFLNRHLTSNSMEADYGRRQKRKEARR